MKPLFLLIDIDNTIYEYADTGFNDEMHDRIYEYAEKYVGVPHEEAVQLSYQYYREYGISLMGYYRHHNVNPKQYADHVHQCSYHKLKLNAPLKEMLTRMQYKAAPLQDDNTGSGSMGGIHHLYFFTNANRAHALNVLSPLGLKGIFSRERPASSPVNEFHKEYDDTAFEEAVQWMGFSYEDQWRLTQPDIANKPMTQAYQAIYDAIDAEVASDEALADVEAVSSTAEHKRQHLKPERMVMVDDSLMNMDGPLQLGWRAVWYAHDGEELPADNPLYADAVSRGQMKIIRDILELEEVVDGFAKEQ